MSSKSSRRGIWVPKACTIPLVIIGLILIVANSCSHR
jgi:hypothetical protein